MTRSQRPRDVRKRLREGKNISTKERRAEIATLYEKPIEDWDWEELAHGRPRNVAGNFQGPRPTWVTPAMVDEATRRGKLVTRQQLALHSMQAIVTLTDLMKNNDVDDFGKPVVPAGVKADVAKYMINQYVGTPQATLEVESHNPLVDLLGGILVNPSGDPSHQIIEGEIVEESDDEDG